ncbi:MAG TPA: hypothetical protein VF242_00070 [Nitrososphaeraceae archaeon]
MTPRYPSFTTFGIALLHKSANTNHYSTATTTFAIFPVDSV